MIVEIPKASRNRYEMVRKTGEIVLDRMLSTATRSRPTAACRHCHRRGPSGDP